MDRRRPIICCLDGNIGAGKSSVLDELRRRGYNVFKEDVESWEWCLSNYYEDQKRWAFTLQMLILNSMIKQFDNMKNSSSLIVFVERSPISNIIFSNVALSNGMMTDDEYRLLKGMIDRFGWIPDLTLMLNISTEECYKRIRRRNRLYERNISMYYLLDLEKAYNAMALDHDFIVINDVHDEDTIDTIIDKISNVKL
jgi:deoxyadenosine/deoxycytidine kinase